MNKQKFYVTCGDFSGWFKTYTMELAIMLFINSIEDIENFVFESEIEVCTEEGLYTKDFFVFDTADELEVCGLDFEMRPGDNLWYNPN